MQQGWREAPISRGLVAFVATTILCVGFTVQAFQTDNNLAIPVFLVALTVSNLATHRGLTLLIAAIASAMLATAYATELLPLLESSAGGRVPEDFLIALAAIRIATSILL